LHPLVKNSVQSTKDNKKTKNDSHCVLLVVLALVCPIVYCDGVGTFSVLVRKGGKVSVCGSVSDWSGAAVVAGVGGVGGVGGKRCGG